MHTIRFMDELKVHVMANSANTVYNAFNTSSSSTDDSSDSSEAESNELVNDSNMAVISEFFKKYLMIKREYRDIIEIKIAHPEYSHGRIAKELGISRKHLYYRYTRMLCEYPELTYFSHRIYINNPKRAFNSRGLLGGEVKRQGNN